LLVYLPFHILFTHFYIVFRCKYTHFSNTEYCKITHFYTNNKQTPNNQAIPIAYYQPEDIQNVSKKVIINPKKHTFTNSAWLHMSETACGRFAGLRGMPATTESVMSTALIRINTANSNAG
jgi:hypothetical protein